MSVFGDAVGDYLDEMESWARRRWTLPPYKSAAFYAALDKGGITLADVQATVMYAHALDVGMIVADEWTGAEVYVGSWDPALPAERQIGWIIRRARDEIQRVQADAEARAGRPLFDEELGSLLLRHMEVRGGAVIDGEDLVLAPVAEIPGAAQAGDQGLLWSAALRHVGESFAQIVLGRPVPRFYVRPGARGEYLPQRAAIVIPSAEAYADQFQRAVYRYLVEHGVAKRAVTFLRNRAAYAAPLVRVAGGGYALPGPWVDASDGLLQAQQSDDLDAIVASGKAITADGVTTRAGGYEYLLGVAARCVEANVVGLATTWMRSPDQVALYYALSQGSFVESPEGEA